MPENITGVEGAPVAGEQQATEDQDAGLSFFEEGAGVDQSAAAGQKEEAEDQRVEQAFAKRLAQERERIKREIEQEFLQRFGTAPGQQTVAGTIAGAPLQQAASQPAPNIEERAQKLAEEAMIPVEIARKMVIQEETARQQEERLKNLATKLFITEDNIAKTEAKTAIEKRRASEPHLPPFDEQALAGIRLRHYQTYGVFPSWEDAYKMYVAENYTSGKLARDIEQQAISRITGRDRVNVQIGRAEQPQKRSWEDLSREEFLKYVERAKRGELRKT
jgi:hypothetical protein